MTDAHIRFATDILRRLGEELNPSIDQGILELVKNAYDADAGQCVVELVDTDRIGGTIRVWDDGDGMNEREIVEGWLVLGRSEKSLATRSQLGRLPAGSKGLGRLAALRLGHRVDLHTAPRDSNDEHRLKIDWDKFDDIQVVEDVGLTIRTSKRRGRRSFGTEILVRDVRQPVKRMDVKRLARSMVLLADPFGDDPSGFSPQLRASEFADLEHLVANRYFQDAEFHLVAMVDARGKATARVEDWRGEVLWEAGHEDLAGRRTPSAYACPPATFELWSFLLGGGFRGHRATVQEVRAWIEAFGGVHLYVNGLRVSPYGNPGNDWLDMNLRRAQSPEERPSTNTAIGRVAVDDAVGALVQKTDRSGFIEDEHFVDLQQFAQDALDWMARERLKAAERRRRGDRAAAPQKTQTSRQRVEKQIEQLPANKRPDVKRAFENYDRVREREVDVLKREVQLYRTLSTAGITAATFAHEIRGNSLKVIVQALKAIERRGKQELGADRFTDTLEKPLTSIRRAVDSLSVLAGATLRLVDHEKRRVGRVELHDVITDILETFGPFFDGRDVKARTELATANPYFRAAPAAVESVLSNLLNNSMAAFERSSVDDREIVIRTELMDKTVALSVLDNGPGIDGVEVAEVWLPGITTQDNGTGLGLTIVRDAVVDLGGRVRAIATGELGGATFVVELPILGV